MSDDDKGDYEVGYCKPPVATRFKPGQSGNPKGAKRKARPTTLMEAYEIALDKRETVKINGKRRRMSRREILAEKTVADAIQGNPAARRDIQRSDQLRAKLKSQSSPWEDGSQTVEVRLNIGDDEITRRVEERLIETKMRENSGVPIPGNS